MGLLVIGVLGVMALAAEAARSAADDPMAPREQAMAFFTSRAAADVARDLAALRPPAVTPSAVVHVLSTLPARGALTDTELQAAVAHEIGHDFFWGEYVWLRDRRDHRGRQELELRCDGIAVLTLAALGAEPRGLLDALRKMMHFNERIGATGGATLYPPLSERVRFVNLLLKRVDSPAPLMLVQRER